MKKMLFAISSVVLFCYVMLAGGVLISTRWFTVAELFPWNLAFQAGAQYFGEQMHTPVFFLSWFVLPSVVFLGMQLKVLAKSVDERS